MVVSSFRRSLSFPNQLNKPKKRLHVRSTSLPCRSSSHPIISQLRDEINELKSWNSSELATWSSLCDGLNRLKIVHESLDDLLNLPQTKESLSCNSDLIEKFLEDFLRFVDVYGIFQTLFLTLKQEFLSVQMAVRRKDETKIAMHVKSLSKIAKEIGKLESSVYSIGKNYFSGEVDCEFAEIIRDVIEVTISVSVSLFGGLSAALDCRKPPLMRLSWKKMKIPQGIREFQEINLEKIMGLRKKDEEEIKMVSQKMQELVEDCMAEIESCGERSFRSLINTRVSLLNVLTQ